MDIKLSVLHAAEWLRWLLVRLYIQSQYPSCNPPQKTNHYELEPFRFQWNKRRSHDEKSRYTETQIVRILKEVEAGQKVNDVCHEYDISDAAY